MDFRAGYGSYFHSFEQCFKPRHNQHFIFEILAGKVIHIYYGGSGHQGGKTTQLSQADNICRIIIKRLLPRYLVKKNIGVRLVLGNEILG